MKLVVKPDRDYKPLAELTWQFPELAEIVRWLNPKFVPIIINTCSQPVDANDALMTDWLIYGLFFIDRSEFGKTSSTKLMRQDFFAIRHDAQDRVVETRYYSGPWSVAKANPFWCHVDRFCKNFRGPGPSYGCHLHDGSEVPEHWYSEAQARARDTSRLWQLAFDLALEWCRVVGPLRP